MGSLKYIKPSRVLLKNHPDFSEKWIQDRIADDPLLLGLGDLTLKDKERIQPGAGRLDLLLQDAEGLCRYEVEIQLGRTDESHVIRTIEYWDIERKRYPQYEHVGVIVAEDITSRFLNVISLFNGFIPLVALQMQAFQTDDKVSLIFTTVLSQMQLGLVGEDEEPPDPVNRAYWEERSSKLALSMADDLLTIMQTWDSTLSLRYNRGYIGMARNGQADNFVIFIPKRNWLRIAVRLEQSDDLQSKLDKAVEVGMDFMDYGKDGRYRIRLAKDDIKIHETFLAELLKAAYEESKQ